MPAHFPPPSSDSKPDLEALARRALARCGVEPGEPLLVAISGGPDSTALLLALHATGRPLEAAHCNFGLRPGEADAEQRFVEEMCGRLGVPLHVKAFDVEARRREMRGESVEMACRELRYEWFAQLLNRPAGPRLLAVGHNRDDRVETFFLNLMRGAGERGLRSIRLRNGNIVRPLLEASRTMIVDYLRLRSVEAMTDSSNTQPVYARNRLRLDVLPRLRAAFSRADEAVVGSIEKLAEAESLIDSLMSPKREAYMSADGAQCDVGSLVGAEEMPGAVAWHLLRPLGLSRTATDAIVASAASKAEGRTFAGSDGRLWLLHRGLLRPYSADAQAPHYECCELAPEEFHPRRDAAEAWFDADTFLAGHPAIEFRPWRAADRLRPFGLRGTRLVSDLLSDLHMPVDAKAGVHVLTRNGTIVWVAGVRTSSLFPVTSASRRVLRYRLK